jgi:hypothetical protein
VRVLDGPTITCRPGFFVLRSTNRNSHAKDRGCTKPGCDAPAYHSQVHHVRGWAATRRTDIDDLALACGIDNRLAEKGWTTRTNARGETEWLPPPHLDRGQPRTRQIFYSYGCGNLPPNERRSVGRGAREICNCGSRGRRGHCRMLMSLRFG